MHTLIILLPGIVLAYDLICPSRSQRQLRSQGLCVLKNVKYSEYTCLEDVNRHTFVESCTEKEDFVRPGRRYVFKGQTTSSGCSKDRYQPIKFYKTSGDMCIFLKYKCTENGQVIGTKGSDIADTTCICDYKEGYSYITEPDDIRNCVPSEEDCSCFRKICPQNHFLSADNECICRNVTSMTGCATADTPGIDVTTTMRTDLSGDMKTETESQNISFRKWITILIVTFSFNKSELELHDIFMYKSITVILAIICILISLVCIWYIINVDTAGDNEYFECEVLDANQPEMWFKDETKLSTSDKYEVETHGKLNRLVMYHAKPDDHGEYSVTIESCVQRSDISVQEYFTKTLCSQACIEGANVYFECEVLDDNQTAMWFKDGAKLSTSVKYKLETHGKLHKLVVNDAKSDDQGEYSVTIKSCSQRSDLTVLEYFTKTLDYQVCIEGNNVHFECEVLDDNQTALWCKDGLEVSALDKYKVERQGKCHRLIVNNTSLDDQGEYSVIINNIVRLANLIVQEYFTMTLDSQACVEGESVHFDCAVLDDNQTAQWFKDGAEITMSKKYKLERRKKRHRLVVNNAINDDQGEYSVMIKNCVRRSQLTVQEIPVAIHYMSERDKDLYREIIRTATETRYFIKILIIGEKGVGKTCLLRRLLGETIEDVESTDGIDVVHRCKIRLRDGQWVVDKGTYKRKEIMSRLKIALRSHANEDAHNAHIADKLKYAPPLCKKDITMPSTLSTCYKRQEEVDTYSLQENKLAFSELSTAQVTETTIESRLDKVLSETILNDLSQLINDIEKFDMPLEVMVDCGIWDFAGQMQYYITHSIFLNPNAIHLLVVDIMKDVKLINTDVGYDNIVEYIDFWFDSIHSCRDVDDTMKSISDYVNPPVILVCTGVDKCKDKLDERKKEFCKQLLVMLHNEDKHKHLRSISCISNTEPSDKDFDDLRQSIFEFGKNIETFAVKLPLRWIRLERALNIVNEAGVAILSWPDMINLASKCSIADENEVSLFLKYHHKIGSIIFFESLKEYIILNQKWLADAFRCFISDKYADNLKLTYEWKTLEQTGELKQSLIDKLFKKEPEHQFDKYESLLLEVMEKFGIICKLATITKDSQNKTVSTYYMPCKISRTITIKQIYDLFGVKRATCSPWLCIQFDFLPFDFCNQIFCHYIQKYDVCTEAKSGQVALYHGTGVFFHDNTKSRKFILCFSKNTIGMQIWQWRKLEHGRYRSMLEELRSVIHNVKDKHEPRSVSYTIKAKCANGDIHITAGRYSCQELTNLRHEEYFCEDHNEMHGVKDLFQTWFEEYSKNEDNIPALQTFKEIPNTQFLQRCPVCDKEPSVYWCRDCQISMCKDCYNQHMGSDYTVHRNVQHVYDKFTRTYNFQAIAGEIRDIKVLHDGLLVMVDRKLKQLVTCHITGQEQQTIPLPGLPLCITVVDNNTVAVTLYSKVGIVDARQRQVIKTIDVKVWCYGIIYRESQLFVGCDDRTIKIMNMSGEVKRTIPVGVVPKYICGDELSRFYYTDCVKLYCIDTDVNSVFTFRNENIHGLAGMTTGDKGHILVTFTWSNSVLEISLDGRERHVILRQIPSSSNRHPCICYDSRSELIVIGLQNTVYVYKKL